MVSQPAKDQIRNPEREMANDQGQRTKGKGARPKAQGPKPGPAHFFLGR
jgi:hypothetical protein